MSGQKLFSSDKVSTVIVRHCCLFVAYGWLAVPALIGCQAEPAKPADQSTVTKATVAPTVGPSVVELQKATAIIDSEDIARLEIFYQFTSGTPAKHYLCKLRFPNKDRDFSKFMAAGELSQEGSFKTAIEAGDPPPDSFEITLSEAESPDAGYTVISNTLTGKFQEPTAEEGTAP